MNLLMLLHPLILLMVVYLTFNINYRKIKQKRSSISTPFLRRKFLGFIKHPVIGIILKVSLIGSLWHKQGIIRNKEAMS